MTTATIDQIESLEREATKRYREMVFASVEGKEVDLDELRTVLSDSGKGPEQFKADVRRVAERYEAVVTDAESIRKIEQRMADRKREHARLMAHYNQVKEQTDAMLKEAWEPIERLDFTGNKSADNMDLRDRQRRRREVIRETDDPEIASRLNQVQLEIQATEQEVASARANAAGKPLPREERTAERDRATKGYLTDKISELQSKLAAPLSDIVKNNLMISLNKYQAQLRIIETAKAHLEECQPRLERLRKEEAELTVKLNDWKSIAF